MKWDEVIQQYFILHEENIDKPGAITKTYTANKPLTIKGHCYEKKLDIHRDVELNDVTKIDYLILEDEYIQPVYNPTHVIMVYSSIAKLCTFEMLGDNAIYDWDLEVITDNED